MSSWVCSPEHIGALAAYFARQPYSAHSAEDIAEIWARENLRGVASRYEFPDLDSCAVDRTTYDNADAFVAACRQETFDPAHAKLPLVTLIKMQQCLEYQSCDSADFEQTEAAKLLSRTLGVLISELPGYSDAPWGYDRPGPVRVQS